MPAAGKRRKMLGLGTLEVRVCLDSLVALSEAKPRKSSKVVSRGQGFMRHPGTKPPCYHATMHDD